MKTIKKIMLFIISGLLTFFLCDFFLFFSGAISKSNSEFYDDIGKGLRSNYTYTSFNEGFSITRINELRYLGPEYPFKKNDSTIRIALLGDSYLSTHHVFDRNHTRSILEKTLKESIKNIEVLNFGRASFNLGNTNAYYTTFVEQFSPDYNLFFVSKNDLLSINSYNPLFIKTIYNETQELTIDNGSNYYSKKDNLMHSLLQNSTFMSMINNVRRQIKKNGVLLTILGQNRVYKKQETLVKELTSPVKSVLENILKKNNILVWREKESPPLAFIEWVKKNNANLIDLSTIQKSQISNGQDPHYWKVTNQYGHWNHLGHKIAGKEIAKEVMKIINSNQKQSK